MATAHPTTDNLRTFSLPLFYHPPLFQSLCLPRCPLTLTPSALTHPPALRYTHNKLAGRIPTLSFTGITGIRGGPGCYVLLHYSSLRQALFSGRSTVGRENECTWTKPQRQLWSINIIWNGHGCYLYQTRWTNAKAINTNPREVLPIRFVNIFNLLGNLYLII